MGMIKNFKDLVGKEVAVCYPSPDKLTLFWVGGGDLQIKNGSNVWRVLDEDSHILMSSADLFFVSTDMKSIEHCPIEDFDVVDTEDEDEMGKLSERLEAHTERKTQCLKDKMEGAVVNFAVCDVETNGLYDVTVEFNNGVVLQAFIMLPC